MKIQETDEGFIILTDKGTKPGRYSDRKAAKYAVEFSDEELQELADTLNFNSITYEMLLEKAMQRDKA